MHNKLTRYFKIFFFSNYIYELPKQSKVLIYDSNASVKKIISCYLKSTNIDHLYVRGEFLNLPVFPTGDLRFISLNTTSDNSLVTASTDLFIASIKDFAEKVIFMIL